MLDFGEMKLRCLFVLLFSDFKNQNTKTLPTNRCLLGAFYILLPTLGG